MQVLLHRIQQTFHKTVRTKQRNAAYVRTARNRVAWGLQCLQLINNGPGAAPAIGYLPRVIRSTVCSRYSKLNVRVHTCHRPNVQRVLSALQRNGALKTRFQIPQLPDLNACLRLLLTSLLQQQQFSEQPSFASLSRLWPLSRARVPVLLVVQQQQTYNRYVGALGVHMTQQTIASATPLSVLDAAAAAEQIQRLARRPTAARQHPK